MMKNVTKTNNKTALLAILAVFAMVAAGAAVVMASSEDVDATATATASASATKVTLVENAYVMTEAVDISFKNTTGNGATITLPAGSSTNINMYFYNVDGATSRTVTLNAFGTYTGTVNVYVASADPGDASVTYYKGAYVTFTAAGSVGVSVSTENPIFTATATLKSANIALGGSLVVPESITVTDLIVSGAQKDNSQLNKLKVTLTTPGGKTLTFANSDAGAMTATPSAADITVTTLQMQSGSVEVAGNALTAITNKTDVLVSAGTGVAVGDKWYAPNATGVVNAIAIGPVTGLNMTLTGTLSATAKDVDGTYTVGTTPYQIDATGATFTLTAGEITTLTAGTLELVRGDFNLKAGTAFTPDTLTIDAAATLTIAGAGSTFQGVINNYGAITAAAAQTLTGVNAETLTVNTYPDARISKNVAFAAGAEGTLVKADKTTGTQGLSGAIEADMTIGSAKLDNALTVPADITLTVNGVLELGTNNLNVNGNLVVGANGQIVTTTGKIVLGADSTFANSGKLGNSVAVKVDIGSTQYVTVQGVLGIQIEAAKVNNVDAIVIYGNLIKADPSFDCVSEVVASDVYTDGNITVSTGVTLSAPNATPLTIMPEDVLTVMNGASLGKADDDKVVIAYDAAVVMNGYFHGIISAMTQAGIKADLSNYTGNVAVTVTSTDATQSITGFTIYTDRVSYVDNNGAVMYDQRAYIFGSIVSTTTTATHAAIGGYLFVASDDTLTMSDKGYIDNTGAGYLVAQGTISYPYGTAVEDTYGVSYNIAPEGGANTIYWSDFDTAFSMIDYSVGKTINVSGFAALNDKSNIYAMPATLNIESGWVINATGTAAIKIGADSTVNVASGATLKASGITSIDGKLVVESGASCVPSTAQYAVVSTDSTGTKTYAGIAVILAEAEAGDKITLSGDATSSSVLTIPNGVEFTIAATLTTKGLVVSEDATVKITAAGTLVLKGTASSPFTFNVKGSLDATAGTITPNTTGTVASSGVFKTATVKYAAIAGAAGVTIIGATYAEDANTILTTAEAAIDSGNNVTISTKYSSSEDIVLAEGKTLTINNDAEVTIGSLTIIGGTVNAAAGKLNAEICGVAGVDGAQIVDIQLTGFSGQISDLKTINSKAEEVWTFQTAAAMTAGSVYVSQGTLTVAHELAAAAGNGDSFTVADDAALYLSVDPNFTNFELVTIAGDITAATGIGMTTNVDTIIAGNVTTKGAFDAKEDLVVSGSLTVAGASKVGTLAGGDNGDSFVLTGSLTIPETATLTVKAYMFVDAASIGAGASISGIIALDNSACVISDDEISSNFAKTVNELVLAINTIPYEYVYANNNQGPTFGDFLGMREITFSVPGLDLTGIKYVPTVGTDTNWINTYGEAISKNDKVGGMDYAVFLAAISTVDITTSWDTGMSLYIDNVKVTLPQVTLEVGTHTVMVKADPGYKFADGTTPVITFDGKVITGLMIFEITALTEDGAVLSAVADVVVDEQPIPEQKEKDDTMMIILLAILVIMIAILVVVVILRMMRN